MEERRREIASENSSNFLDVPHAPRVASTPKLHSLVASHPRIDRLTSHHQEPVRQVDTDSASLLEQLTPYVVGMNSLVDDGLDCGETLSPEPILLRPTSLASLASSKSDKVCEYPS